MAYSLYRLEFITGIHIGRDTGGVSLDDSLFTIHSDTIFSAMCCECAKNGDISRLYEYFEKDILTISDALPYSGNEYFLPRPMLYKKGSRSKSKPELRKVLKSLEFIPVSAFDEYINGLSEGKFSPDKLKYDFGGLTAYTKVNMRGQPEPEPYQVAYWKFAENTGLYIIVYYEKQEALDLFESTLNSLGLSGIGGKKSAGLGKFNAVKADLPQKLENMLNDSGSEYQMMLGTALPDDKMLDDVLSDGWYMAIRRGGFVSSENYSDRQLKKCSIYMLAPGSCLRRRFNGGMFDVSDGGTHPVWRCGKTLFAGVNV